MSEQDSTISTEDEDVELHKKRQAVMASEEKRDEAEPEEDDVELHRHRNKTA